MHKLQAHRIKAYLRNFHNWRSWKNATRHDIGRFCLQRAAACERYDSSLQEIQLDERQAQAKAEEHVAKGQELVLYKVCYPLDNDKVAGLLCVFIFEWWLHVCLCLQCPMPKLRITPKHYEISCYNIVWDIPVLWDKFEIANQLSQIVSGSQYQTSWYSDRQRLLALNSPVMRCWTLAAPFAAVLERSELTSESIEN